MKLFVSVVAHTAHEDIGKDIWIDIDLDKLGLSPDTPTESLLDVIVLAISEKDSLTITGV